MLIYAISRLLTEDPNQRLGAAGASEVKLKQFIFVFFVNRLVCLSCLIPFLAILFSISSSIKMVVFEFIIQVKQHVFFKDINWDTLARQKVCNMLF